MNQSEPDQKVQQTQAHTHPLTTSQRLKRTLQEYEQSILQQQAAAEEDLLKEAVPAPVQNSKQVCPGGTLSNMQLSEETHEAV